MKRLPVAVTTLLTFGAPYAVFAASKINTILNNIISLLQKVVLIVFTLAVIMFGWGIVKLIAAAGNPQEIKNAKSIILWGVIGMAVLASIAGIIAYFQNFFLISTANPTIRVPQF